MEKFVTDLDRILDDFEKDELEAEFINFYDSSGYNSLKTSTDLCLTPRMEEGSAVSDSQELLTPTTENKTFDSFSEKRKISYEEIVQQQTSPCNKRVRPNSLFNIPTDKPTNLDTNSSDSHVKNRPTSLFVLTKSNFSTVHDNDTSKESKSEDTLLTESISTVKDMEETHVENVEKTSLNENETNLKCKLLKRPNSLFSDGGTLERNADTIKSKSDYSPPNFVIGCTSSEEVASDIVDLSPNKKIQSQEEALANNIMQHETRSHLQQEEMWQGIPVPQLGRVMPQWVDDNASNTCMECQAAFSVFRRRHHCRACGRLLCARCCAWKTILSLSNNSSGNTPKSTTPQRVCAVCFNHLVRIEAAEKHGKQHSMLQQQQPLQQDNNTDSLVGSTKSVIFFDGVRPGGVLNSRSESQWQLMKCHLDDSNFSLDFKKKLNDYWEAVKQQDQESYSTVENESGKLKYFEVAIADNLSVIIDLVPAEECASAGASTGAGAGAGHVATTAATATAAEVAEVAPISNADDNENVADNEEVVSTVTTTATNSTVTISPQICWRLRSIGMVSLCFPELQLLLQMNAVSNIDDRLYHQLLYVLQFFISYRDLACTDDSKSLFPLVHCHFLELPPNVVISGNWAGILLVPASREGSQSDSTRLRPPIFCTGLPVHSEELEWARLMPLRLLLAFGMQAQRFPCPQRSSLQPCDRVPVYSSDNQQLSVVHLMGVVPAPPHMIAGLRLHLEPHGQITISLSRRSGSLPIPLSSGMRQLVLCAGLPSPQADSHLVCWQQQQQNQQMCYSTQAISDSSAGPAPPCNTGATMMILLAAPVSTATTSSSSSSSTTTTTTTTSDSATVVSDSNGSSSTAQQQQQPQSPILIVEDVLIVTLSSLQLQSVVSALDSCNDLLVHIGGSNGNSSNISNISSSTEETSSVLRVVWRDDLSEEQNSTGNVTCINWDSLDESQRIDGNMGTGGVVSERVPPYCSVLPSMQKQQQPQPQTTNASGDSKVPVAMCQSNYANSKLRLAWKMWHVVLQQKQSQSVKQECLDYFWFASEVASAFMDAVQPLLDMLKHSDIDTMSLRVLLQSKHGEESYIEWRVACANYRDQCLNGYLSTSGDQQQQQQKLCSHPTTPLPDVCIEYINDNTNFMSRLLQLFIPNTNTDNTVTTTTTTTSPASIASNVGSAAESSYPDNTVQGALCIRNLQILELEFYMLD